MNNLLAFYVRNYKMLHYYYRIQCGLHVKPETPECNTEDGWGLVGGEGGWAGVEVGGGSGE